jgi:hypothetical protein
MVFIISWEFNYHCFLFFLLSVKGYMLSKISLLSLVIYELLWIFLVLVYWFHRVPLLFYFFTFLILFMLVWAAPLYAVSACSMNG